MGALIEYDGQLRIKTASLKVAQQYLIKSYLLMCDKFVKNIHIIGEGKGIHAFLRIEEMAKIVFLPFIFLILNFTFKIKV